tara:strand:- start:848 stop:1123 length:276 start_codon:yes stop_codon:yes gene_type:complete
MSKKDKLLEIIEQIQELYPKLNRLMVTDLEDPDSIIITTEERLIEMAEEYGIDPDMIEGLTEDDLQDPLDEYLAQIDWDYDDDDEGGGMIQ